MVHECFIFIIFHFKFFPISERLLRSNSDSILTKGTTENDETNSYSDFRSLKL